MRSMRAPLLTDRLALRDVTEADAELLRDLDSDPEVMRYISPQPPPSVADYRDRIRSVHMPLQAHDWQGVRVVLGRAGGEFLGWVFVRPATAFKYAREIGWALPDEVEVGYRYRRSAWGRGIATEAAAPLVRLALTDAATSAVVACARADNAGSLRVLEKLGLERVGQVVLPETKEPVVKLARVKPRPPAT
jgi:RimJ/RimL family protein N-acetyltransferase